MTRGVFPFAVGCGRSGTTLLRAMLDSHPQLAIPGESRFIPTMAARRDRYERAEGFAVEAFISDLAATPWFRHWGLSVDDAAGAVADRRPGDVADAFRALYALQADIAGKPRY